MTEESTNHSTFYRLLAVVVVVIALFTGFYWISKDAQSSPDPTMSTHSGYGPSSDLILALDLQQRIYYEIEKLETGRTTKEQFKRFADPVAARVDSVHAYLSMREAVIFDSLTQIMGQQMIDNILKAQSK